MADLSCLVSRLEAAVVRLEGMSVSGGGGASAGGGAGGAVSKFVEEYDEIVNGAVAQYLSLSQKIGGDVQKHAEMMKQGFAAVRQILVIASSHRKPSNTELQSVIQPVSKVVSEVQNFREKNRSSPMFNHLSAVSESVGCLGWIAVSPKPGPYVKEMMDAGVFYTNRVLKDYKEKDKTHVEWVKAYNNIWTDLQSYIKVHHTTGLEWSKTGPVASASSSPAPPPPPPSGGAPPPPPPGPPPPPMDLGGSGDSGGESRNALFASINQGSDITKGLKHVSDAQKTHKNPALRGGGGAVRSGPKPFSSAPKPAAAAPAPARTQPPVCELEGKKWRVENQAGKDDLLIKDTEQKQMVYVYKCSNSTVTVKGKINGITIDNCKKVGLVFDDVIGTVEVINSQAVKVQVIGKVPSISIEKTDGCQVFLSEDSLNCQFTTAKSSEMNIVVPKSDGDCAEFPVPEQFKTVWNGCKFETTISELA